MDAMCIDGGAYLHTSHGKLKQWAHEVNTAEPLTEPRKPVKWSNTPIIFDAEEHPDRITVGGCMSLLVSPRIHNLRVMKMLVDSGVGLNLISPNVIKRMQIPDMDIKEMDSFEGVARGRSQLKGKITLPVTFGRQLNFMIERVIFDVAKMSLSYNGILGRPALGKFMVASHYTYNTLKMLGTMSIITIHADKKDTVLCIDKIFREAVQASADKAPAPVGKTPGAKNKSKTFGKTREESGKRSAECSSPVDDSPETSST
ncbi:hypothetical protein ZWY2020_040326 [Hordeum vulgare]|nr:hypothetical protein ZWY2020_040326 [Hordeum vulgare]